MSRRWYAAVLAGALAVAALAGCANDGADEPGDNPGLRAAGFPMTVGTAYGDITIKKKPERIVALMPSYLDILSSLGIAPVAFETGTLPLADFDQNFPWLADTYDQADAVPELLTAEGSADLEKIAGFRPDLILAAPWYVSEKTYEEISAIAPTYVGRRDDDQLTPLDQMITDVGALTGSQSKAETVNRTIEDVTESAREQLSRLQSKTYISVAVRADGFQFDGSNLQRDIGLEPADNQGTFNSPKLSFENIDQLDADVLFIGTFDDASRSRVESDPRFSSLPAVRNGTVVFSNLAMANSSVYPGPRAHAWLLEQVVPQLAASALSKGATP